MEENQSKPQTFLAGSIIAAALIVGGAMVYSSGNREGTLAQVAGETSNRTPEIAENIPPTNGDNAVLGDPNAPVTIISFGDFQCPYCKVLFDGAEKEIRKEFIATGKVKMVYRDFPLDSIHPYARSMAEAAQCAKDQGKYWLYHDALFERQESIPTLDVTALAGELGLDTKAFDECVESGKYKDEVEKDFQDGIAAGVRGTPGNFINGKPYHGALPYATLKKAIEEALKE